MSRLLLALLLVGCACQSAGGVGARCSASADCSTGLGCAVDRCALPCTPSSGCTTGLSCVSTSSGTYCLADGTFSDTGVSEAGPSDGSPLDADTGASSLDAGSLDAGASDAEPTDAGHTTPRGVLGACVGTTAACVIASDHDVYCWGSGAHGLLGGSCGDVSQESAPRRIVGVAGVDALACGDGFACAHQAAGAILCWGRNELGQLAHDTTSPCEPTPSPALDTTGAPLVLASADLVAAGAHACVLDLAHGSVLCWGRDDAALDVRASALRDRVYTRASDAMQPLRDAPTLTGGAFVTQLALSASGASARTTSRDLYLWGDNAERQTANVTGAQYSAILNVGAGRGAFAIAGRAHRCALDGVGAVCWGSNALGQLGHPPSAGAATCSEGACEGAGAALGNFTSIATSGDGDTSCGVVSGGAAVRCWGDNAHGLAGVPTATAPIAYLDGSIAAITFPGAMRLPFSRVYVGPRAACAIDGAAIAWCWGDHDLDPATADVSAPTALVLAGP